MNDDQLKKSKDIINELIQKNESMRAFARSINEDASDVMKWKNGKKVKSRAVITIAEVYSIHPYNLRPDLFPENMKIKF